MSTRFSRHKRAHGHLTVLSKPFLNPARSMSLPRPGEAVKVILRNGEPVEGVIEWMDGNGAWVKSPQKARWVPLEAFLTPPEAETKKEPPPEE